MDELDRLRLDLGAWLERYNVTLTCLSWSVEDMPDDVLEEWARRLRHYRLRRAELLQEASMEDSANVVSDDG